MAQNLAYLYSERARLIQDITSLQQQLTYAQNNSNPSIIAGIQSRLTAAEELLAVVEEQIRNTQAQQQLETTSSGQVIIEERTTASNPATPVGVMAPDGRINRENVETGTNDPVRTQVDTQATPPANNGTLLPFATGDEDGNLLPGYTTTQAGASARGDDNTAPNSNSTSQIIDSRFNQRIVPEPNVLDSYASYTYAITWYLLTPTQYNEMVSSQKKNCASWQLLMQSGGAPAQAAGASAGRNQYFNLDYYIDDLEIDSLVPLKGTGAANTATDIKFKVTEPNGITLIENLYKAVSNLYKQKNVSNQANYPMAQYCLVVRFYGYNDNGELVTTGRRGTNGATNLTDPKAIVEKFYPFVITNIRFRIPKDRIVEYAVEGKPIPHFYNKSQDRGTIPFGFELVGETVDQVLRGKPVGTVYPASPGERRDSPQPSVSAPTQPDDTSVFDDPVAFAASSGLGA